MSEPATWFISRNGDQRGPFSTSEIKAFARAGTIRDTDFLWIASSQEWKLYSQLKNDPLLTRKPKLSASSLLVMRRILRSPLTFVSALKTIIVRPSKIGQTEIDTDTRDLGRAIGFYIQAFTISYLVQAWASRYSFYEGLSQHRYAVEVAIELAMALPFIYIASKIFRRSVSVSGVAQAALYADGAYLVALAATWPWLRYLAWLQSSASGVRDVIGTEIESCFAQQSWVYWAVRGDLQFYLPGTYVASAHDKAAEYFALILILPFCYAYASMLHARYGVPRIVNLLVAAGAFVAATSAYGVVEGTLRTATRDPVCYAKGPQEALLKFNQSLLKEQIATKATPELRGFWTNPPLITASSEGLSLDFTYRSDIAPSDFRSLSTEAVGLIKSNYCNGAFRLGSAAAMGYVLELRFRTSSGQVVRRELLAPQDCK